MNKNYLKLFNYYQKNSMTLYDFKIYILFISNINFVAKMTSYLWVKAEGLYLSAPLDGAVRAVMLALNNYL